VSPEEKSWFEAIFLKKNLGKNSKMKLNEGFDDMQIVGNQYVKLA
jgi:hypothetical protein